MARLSSRRVYTGRIFNVDIDSVRFPDASDGELEMVRHPGASAVLPFVSDPTGDDPEVMLVRQFRHAADAFIYEIPAGRIDGHEDPTSCAARELLEETGCTAERLEHMYTFYTTPGFTDERIHAFMAVGLTAGKTNQERDEFLSLETVPLSRALEMIRSGELMDAKSALTILYAARFRLGR